MSYGRQRKTQESWRWDRMRTDCENVEIAVKGTVRRFVDG